MQTLRSWRIIDQAQLHGVRFICLEASKLDNARRGTEHTVGAHCVVDVLLGNAYAFVGLGLRDDASLNLDLILTVGWRLVSQTLFKILAPLVLKLVLWLW